MKVLFLDIDGVLNRFDLESIGSKVEDDLIENLVYVIKETGCKIVISSSWKMAPILMDILEENLFPKLPAGCVIGCTPDIVPQVNREVEIKQWLDKHQGEVEKYVIVDDYNFELKSLLEQCVITDALTGFTKENANECVRRLK